MLGQRAEIAVEHRCGGRGKYTLRILPLPEGFIVRHKKQPVLAIEELRNANRAVQLEAELVPLEGILLLRLAGKKNRAWRPEHRYAEIRIMRRDSDCLRIL